MVFQYTIKAGFFQYLLNFLVCTDKKRIAAQQILHIAFPLKGLYEQWMHFYNWGMRCEQGLGLLPGWNGHTAMPIDMDTIPLCCLLDCFLDDGNRERADGYFVVFSARNSRCFVDFAK